MKNQLFLILIATRNRSYHNDATAVHLDHEDRKDVMIASKVEDIISDPDATSYSNDIHSDTERQSLSKKET